MVRAVNIFNALNATLVQEDDIYSSDCRIERQKIRHTDLNKRWKNWSTEMPIQRSSDSDAVEIIDNIVEG